jgi:GGDEF domain-containing protein
VPAARPADDAEQLVLDLVQRADVPLYEVKRAGRDGVRVAAG